MDNRLRTPIVEPALQPEPSVPLPVETAIGLPDNTSTERVPVLKTREDYLLRFEAQLLDSLKDSYISVNRQVTLSYAIAMLVELFYSGRLNKLAFAGLDIVINDQTIRSYAPIILCLVMAFVNRDLARIRDTIREIQTTEASLSKLNVECSPLRMQDLYLFSTGVTGLILSLARSQLSSIIKHNPFRNVSGTAHRRVWTWIGKAVIWFLRTTVPSLAVLAIFLLPGIGLGLYLWHGLAFQNTLQINVTLCIGLILLLITVSYTAVNSVKLFISYSIDYAMSLRDEFHQFKHDNVKNYVDLLKKMRGRFPSLVESNDSHAHASNGEDSRFTDVTDCTDSPPITGPK